MDQVHPDPGIVRVPMDDVVCCSLCSGAAITMKATEWSQFALGQLVAVGIGTSLLALIVLVLSLCSPIE